MQVALDYYRMLMVPIQADAHQIQQAYQERASLHLEADHGAWVGFTPQAWQARGQLLQEAAATLLDQQERHTYDAQLTAINPSLEISDPLLSGALLLLCESGDYPAALQLSNALLTSSQPESLFSDVILTAAIARMEMGRESWQNNAYEEAAQLLTQALATLEEYRAFPQVQAEVTTDLGKLRPYRILDLLSAPDLTHPNREQGLNLLRAMLDDRQGIEGQGQDHSGLNTQDFLRFVQRVRRQLTLAEQQPLFEAEANRPSTVAAFLTVQILMARGYVEHRPAMVRLARGFLVRLAQRQDVRIEQAICSLMLGQTEDALQHLQSSQEQERMAFIREHSAGSPDYLPGLCRFAEKWYQDEIFPEFRQLDAEQVSLQSYFNDEGVQTFLDEMTTKPEPPSSLRFPRSASDPLASSATPSWDEAASEPSSLSMSDPSSLLSRDPLPAPSNLDPLRPPSNRPDWLELPQRPRSSFPDRDLPETNGLRPQPPASSELRVPRGSADLGLDPMTALADELDPGAGRSRSTRRRTGPSPLIKLLLPLGVVGLAGLLIVISWQVLKNLFSPGHNSNVPDVSLTSPPVVIPTPVVTPVAPQSAIPPEWEGTQQVKVLSADGVNIRQDPNRQAPLLATVPRSSLLKVTAVEPGSDPQIPVWLKVERQNGSTGWIAAQSGTTRLVERIP